MLSQATACDGFFYQIPAGNNAPNPPPGVLPIGIIIDLEDSRLQAVQSTTKVELNSTKRDP